MRPVRLLLAAALVAYAAVAGAAMPTASAAAVAPACQKQQVRELTGSATVVFSGTVTSIAPEATGAIVQSVSVALVYKGDDRIGTEDVQVRTGSGRCQVGALTEGERYMFFATADADDVWLAAASGETRLATDSLLTQVEGILGRGRTPVPPEPETASLTQVGDTATPQVTRLAAPGLAMVLVGFLGLLVVGRLGRTRA